MDIALARKSGQGLHNEYVITDSPAYDNLRLFFHAAVRELRGIARVYHDCPSIHITGQEDVHDILETERLMDTRSLSPPIPSSPVVTTTDDLQSPVEQMTDLISPGSDHTQFHAPISRGAVSDVSLASMNLLTHVEPLPLNQLICHSAATVRSWPAAHRNDLLAVAYRDMAVARRNMVDLTCYLDVHVTHIAACSGALDDNLPLMSAEITPRVTGGIWSVLIEADQSPEGASAAQD